MLTFHNIAKGSNHMVKFLHIATGLRVEFPAFITEFNDRISVEWGTESIFGRMDPIKNYRGTTRSISLGFDVLAPSLEMARENMINYSRLVQMMYPVYSQPLGMRTTQGRVINSPPLIRLQFLNLVKSVSTENSDQGLMGCISGFQFAPDRNAGFFAIQEELFPKSFNISFQFDPQHEGELGFEGNEFLSVNFPYGTEQQQPQESQPASNNPEVNSKRQSDILGGS